jgi:hypothetical protein
VSKFDKPIIKKTYNIREAIQKNDLIRIRNGSPGQRSKQLLLDENGGAIDPNY